jgi:hypothetical protein
MIADNIGEEWLRIYVLYKIVWGTEHVVFMSTDLECAREELRRLAIDYYLEEIDNLFFRNIEYKIRCRWVPKTCQC